ncbi:MAG: helix-turn-helix domain-containing protein [bacterium]
MDEEKYRRYFDILELPPTATFTDVRNAYLHLKDLYSRDSIVTSPILDEFSEESMQNIVQEIEVAYHHLVAYFNDVAQAPAEEVKGSPVVPSSEMRKDVEQIASFSGPVLREIREKLRIGLHEIALATNIRMRYLEDIELEKFEVLPPEVYLRGFVIDYARHLSLDPRKVADDYIARYRAWKRDSGK